jgi:hypothetical protein
MLESAGVRSVTNAESRETLGLNGHGGADLSGILFPYRSPVTGERVGARIRLDHVVLDDGAKYISEPGCRHLFFPPFPKQWLADTSVLVVIVEAEKSGLALQALADRTGRPMLVIAVGGCWGWKRKIGKRLRPDGNPADETGPSPDFDMIVWKERSAILAFDSNALTNPKVQRARGTLAKEVSRRGAQVLVAEVPAIEGVNGPDDFIARQGDDAMLTLLGSPAAAQGDVIRLERGKLPDAVDEAEKILLDHSERLRIFQLPVGSAIRCAGLRVGARSSRFEHHVSETEAVESANRWLEREIIILGGQNGLLNTMRDFRVAFKFTNLEICRCNIQTEKGMWYLCSRAQRNSQYHVR